MTPKFTGQSVLIIGNGNSGLEMAASIYGSTNFVHITSKSRIKLSWETHYVGDIRGVNNEVIDSYMLKSLDGFFEVNINNLQIKKRTDGSNKLDILPTDGSWKGNFAERVPTREGYDRIIACTGFKWDKAIFSQKSPISDSKLKVKDYWKPIKKRVYQTKISDKYPLINHDYQSADYPGLYFLGTVSHSLDFRKSAGGFIHGFRYSVRALHKILEYRNHGIMWPSKIRKIDQLVSSILNRANEASGLYQMFGHLCDIAIVDKMNKTFTYLEEYPVNLLPHILKYTGHEFDPDENKLFVLTLEYGKKFSEPGADHFSRNRAVLDNPANESNFLHPIIYFYDDRIPNNQQFAEKSVDNSLPEPDDIHHVYEDFTTIFDGPNVHIKPLRRFVEKCLDLDLKMHLSDGCVTEDMASGKRVQTCERFFESDEPSVNSYAANER
uniref:FAD/NAD(P)-binding domain-containing protein n=1 Tax=Romanomermis culicivorax TaxID=13658 RepID=A0A915L503_ROMCU